MNLVPYKCTPSEEAWKKNFNKLFDVELTNFELIFDVDRFSLDNYKGDFPVGLVFKGTHTIGWAKDATPRNFYQLYPHVEDEKRKAIDGHAFYMSPIMEEYNITYAELINGLHNRIKDLKEYTFVPPKIDQYERERVILAIVVYRTKCISHERLIELETNYLYSFMNEDIKRELKRRYDLDSKQQVCHYISRLYHDTYLDPEWDNWYIQLLGPCVSKHLAQGSL
jgi:hypothetical protein